MECKDWLNVVLAIVGILVSAVGLFVAIRQIMRMRRTSEAVQVEVLESHKKIRQTFGSNEIGRAVKNLEQAIENVSKGEYGHALTRMMDVKASIGNDAIINEYLPKEQHSEYSFLKRRFNESYKTVASDIDYPENIDRRQIQSSLIEIQDLLIKIENNIKNSCI